MNKSPANALSYIRKEDNLCCFKQGMQFRPIWYGTGGTNWSTQRPYANRPVLGGRYHAEVYHPVHPKYQKIWSKHNHYQHISIRGGRISIVPHQGLGFNLVQQSNGWYDRNMTVTSMFRLVTIRISTIPYQGLGFNLVQWSIWSLELTIGPHFGPGSTL